MYMNLCNGIPSPEKTGIKVLAFDQGGIYIGVDYDATTKAFQNLGATNAHTLYTQANQTDVVDKFERGKISKEIFYHYLRSTLKGLSSHVKDQALYVAWNAMLTGVIPGVLEFIKALRALGYITIVVSNADIIHQTGVEQQLIDAKVRALFDKEALCKQYISYRIGFNKPYTDIFDFVLQDLQSGFPEYNIKANDILFIDDSAKHITGRNAREGAQTVGWKGLLVEPNLSLANFRSKLAVELQKIAAVRKH